VIAAGVAAPDDWWMSTSDTLDRAPAATAAPYRYAHRELREPDWARIPAWRRVTEREWGDARWQRTNSVRGVRELEKVYGRLLSDTFYEDVARDQRELATMPLLLPPHVLNTMAADAVPSDDALRADPVRRAMLPLRSERHPRWPSHPAATRDSLHESEMWTVEGLTHRYPTKVLAELLTTCPQYCGYCTRMDLVGGSTPQVAKARFASRQGDRFEAMLGYLEAETGVRDVVVSGGDVANLPFARLEAFVSRVVRIEHIREIRIATKALVDLPQLWAQADVLAGMARLADEAARNGVQLSIHTHTNAVESLTPRTAALARTLLELGVREIRNQGVLLRGVNTSRDRLLDLCFALIDDAWIAPYYFYLCDIVPNVEHWRISLAEGQDLQRSLMGYLPGFATPRIVCDVPWAGKRWVEQCERYDRGRGISYWRKSYATPHEEAFDPAAEFEYYDPLHTLGDAGRDWWLGRDAGAAAARARRNASTAW
jgi:lysine 2,3-aminomutase